MNKFMTRDKELAKWLVLSFFGLYVILQLVFIIGTGAKSGFSSTVGEHLVLLICYLGLFAMVLLGLFKNRPTLVLGGTLLILSEFGITAFLDGFTSIGGVVGSFDSNAESGIIAILSFLLSFAVIGALGLFVLGYFFRFGFGKNYYAISLAVAAGLVLVIAILNGILISKGTPWTTLIDNIGSICLYGGVAFSGVLLLESDHQVVEEARQ